ncbi:AfsR/SARP family transcriptional regulator [Nonomuraea soli]|uniref:DNA-binding SARP family transcriptional activator n=1 Tax=Nonomuraea soli TaxID=1032476 RepID=A0A7W0CJK8_9ACTN|nr:tetratricopeptide repeat protein [Nonomuraea soli]MBA2892335.1 DNA-binding SARP family transcriptional activator [Nonomuraea soli]
MGLSVTEGVTSPMAPRHRAVLAYLLLHAGTVIGVERLIGAMWGTTPPDTARAQIQASIAAIRKPLREAGADAMLATQSAGYVIRPEPGQVDLQEFIDRVAAGEIRGALTLWRGQALADVNADYVAQARERLEERRLRAVEQLAEAELVMGHHEVLVEELPAVLDAHPLRERLIRQLMLALHRCGRQADALALGRDFRIRLADEQGLDPSRAFLELERSILRDDAAAVPEPARVRPRILSFLPQDVPDFVGRIAGLDRLAGSGPATISTIDGMAGVGKTALAVHAAHRLADRFPDGQLFVDLHAHTAGHAPLEPSAALETLLRQLGLPPERIPAGEADRTALWRTELANRRLLVVLDNIADTDHVRALLPGTTRSLMLITSRRRLVDLDGASAMSLDVLSTADALALFTAIVGDRVHDEPAAALDVVQLCGGLPLAVRIAAARLRHRPRWTVRYLADRLRDQRRQLAGLTSTDRGVAAAFSLSYEQLGAAQQHLFSLLGLHPGVDIEPHAAAALARLPLQQTETLLEDLLDANMLIQHEPGRYTLHDLLWQYARDTVAALKPPEDRQAALTRLCEHYVEGTGAALAAAFPHYAQSWPAPLPTWERLDSPEAGIAWLGAERANLLAIAPHTQDIGPLAHRLHHYLHEHGYLAQALVLHGRALDSARAEGDREGQALALYHLAVIHRSLGHVAESMDHVRQALDLFTELGDQAGKARALTMLGAGLSLLREFAEAAGCFQQALDICRREGLRMGEAVSLGNLANVHEQLGDVQLAAEHCRHAIELGQELGIPSLKAQTTGILGDLLARNGDYRAAVIASSQALAYWREAGDRFMECSARIGLGKIFLAAGDPAQAVDSHRDALAIALEIGSLLAQGRAHQGLAHAHHALGRPGQARTHAVQAVELFTSLGAPEAGEMRAFRLGVCRDD